MNSAKAVCRYGAVREHVDITPSHYASRRIFCRPAQDRKELMQKEEEEVIYYY